MKKLKERFFKYDKLDRDIFFHPLLKDKKGKPDFYDTCKCMVWEENRTRYEVDEEFRSDVDFNIGIRGFFDKLMSGASSSDESKEVHAKWELFRKEMFGVLSLGQMAKQYYYWSNFPFNIQSWPEKAYLSHPQKARKPWIYEPFEEQKKYEKVSFESIGDKELRDYEEGVGKKVTMKVPITINLDPLWDEADLRRVLNENVETISGMVLAQKEMMENEGYAFRSENPKKQRPGSWYAKGLRFLGHYRMYKCEGRRFHEIENTFEKAWDKGKDRPMDKEHFLKNVKKTLPNLPL